MGSDDSIILLFYNVTSTPAASLRLKDAERQTRGSAPVSGCSHTSFIQPPSIPAGRADQLDTVRDGTPGEEELDWSLKKHKEDRRLSELQVN